MSSEGRLIVVSGPSGVGKTTVCDELLKFARFERVVTCTTRPPREGEIDGRDYHFLTRKEFEEGIRRNRFLEYAHVHDHLYGTPWAVVEDGVRRGKYVLLNIDVQGAAKVRDAIRSGTQDPERMRGILNGRLTTVFLLPPDMAELERRLSQRSTDSEEQVAIRLETARKELLEQDRYDHRVINGDAAQAAMEVLSCVGYVEE